MGLSIHYSGSFRNDTHLKEMIAEIKDIVSVFQWEYRIYEESFPDNSFDEKKYDQDVYGISFTPPKCETIFVTFLSNRKMVSPVSLMFFGKDSETPNEKYLYNISVKTQYSGIENHKLIIHLFRYLNENYFQYFKMFDEGQYWETLDEELLQNIFARYTRLMDDFSSALESHSKTSDETFTDYFQRLMHLINKNNKNDNIK